MEGNGLELTLDSDLELSVLDTSVFGVSGWFSTYGACASNFSIVWGHLEMQILGPTLGLLGLRFRKLSFNNPPDDRDAQCHLRHTWREKRGRWKIERAERPHLLFCSNFTFCFVFKGEAEKKYDAPDFREEKTSPFSHDQAETS